LSEELRRDADAVEAALAELQSMSVANHKNRTLFKEQGIATLTLRTAQRYLTSGLQETDKVQLQISVVESGSALKQAVASSLGVKIPEKYETTRPAR
jgi:hypothetical protein